MEPISPSIWRSAKRKMARKINAVVIASAEYCGCPPGVVPGAGLQAAIAASLN